MKFRLIIEPNGLNTLHLRPEGEEEQKLLGAILKGRTEGEVSFNATFAGHISYGKVETLAITL